MTPSEVQYRALLEKISALGQRQEQAFGEQIQCKLGCYSCCRPPSSFFLVEAEQLQQGIQALSAEEKRDVLEKLFSYVSGKRTLCPLLDEASGGSCRVYGSRPSICRTHGFAIWLRDGGEESEHSVSQEESSGGALSWCELNFTESKPSREVAFDVERLNMMLSLITQLGWKGQEARKGLVDIIKQGVGSFSQTSSHRNTEETQE